MSPPRLHTLTSLFALSMLLLASCTELEDDIAAHPEGWTDPASDNFHSYKVSIAGLTSCSQCHGQNLDGGSSKVACNNENCHSGGGVIPHPENWGSPGEPFHGDQVRLKGFNPCAVCHGADFQGGFTGMPCSNQHCHTNGAAFPHPAGWTAADSVNFHGNWIPVVGLDNCAGCHGDDFSGGAAGVPCSSTLCHTGGDAIPHLDGWITVGNANFHGTWVSSAGLSSCKACHGEDFSGSHAEVACNSSSCHTGGTAIPHLDGWLIKGNANFHGTWVLTEGFSDCYTCHGEDLSGGFTEVACSNSSCHTGGYAIPHPDEWATPGSGLFHGNLVSQSGLDYCADCHGADFSGGIVELACSNGSCHLGAQAIPHPTLAEFTDPTHENYHGSVFWTNNWDFSYCQACHGSDLAGGVADYSCSNVTCHTQPEGVFACDNCHGSSASEPFVDIRNRTSTDLVTVGLHTSHLHPTRNITSTLDCDDCHVVPDSMWATGHIDGSAGQAEVLFGNLATASGTLAPTWDRSAETCSDLYCHGNFFWDKDSSANTFAYADTAIVGNNLTVVWTESYTGDNFCSSCHGYPPTGHLNVTSCGGCHTTVVGGDHLSIIDLTRHLNGQIDYP